MTDLPSLTTPSIRVRQRTASPSVDAAALRSIENSLALKVVDRVVAELKTSSRNARAHSKKQIHQIAASLNQFGFVNPILVGANDEIIAGHGRYAAAKLLGLNNVPTIRLDHLSDVEIRAYRLADNRLAELAGWDEDLLKLELSHLVDFDFEVELTGFETAQIDVILSSNEATASKIDPDDAVPAIAEQAVTRRGDLWLLDDHRILCGDAREQACYHQLSGGVLAQMIFTDPPYNVAIDGHAGGLGKIKHRPFPMASGEMTKAEFTGFIRDVFKQMAADTQDAALIYTCIYVTHLN